MRTHSTKLLPSQSSTQGTAGLGPVARVLRRPGEPLAPPVRAFMEPRFGHDFSQVRVHRDAQAAASADSLGAAAYTVGRAIVFGPGQYQPQAAAGRRLIAHELTHTLQQRGPAEGPLELGAASGPGEAAAARSAGAVMAGGRPEPGPAVSPRVQRQPRGGGSPPLPSLAEGLASQASPLMASMLGSTTLPGFAIGSAQLTSAHRQEIHRLAPVLSALLLRYPLSTVRVIGHSDTVGAAPANVSLGQARADAVKAALVAAGIAEGSLAAESVGEGSPQPVATRDEVPEERNRSVEVRFSARGFPGGRSFLGGAPPSLSSTPSSATPSLFPPRVGGLGFPSPGGSGAFSPAFVRQIPAPTLGFEETLGGFLQTSRQAENSGPHIGVDLSSGVSASGPSNVSPTTFGVTIVYRNLDAHSGDDSATAAVDFLHEPNISVNFSPDPNNAQVYQAAITLVNLHLRRHRRELIEIGLSTLGSYAQPSGTPSGGAQLQLELHLTSRFSITTGTSLGVVPHSSGPPDPGSIPLGTARGLDWTWTPFSIGSVFHFR